MIGSGQFRAGRREGCGRAQPVRPGALLNVCFARFETRLPATSSKNKITHLHGSEQHGKAKKKTFFPGFGF